MITFYRLRDTMNRKGKTLTELRKIMSPATVNKLRRNEIVTTDTIDKLCKWLECQPDAILEYQDEKDVIPAPVRPRKKESE